MKILKLFITCLIFAAGTEPLIASDLTIPNNFSANTTAVAADVNANFTAVEAAVDDNDANINSNASNISTNTSDINTNASNISTNVSDINTNTSNIAINTSDINSLSSQVTSLGTGYIGAHSAELVFANPGTCGSRLNINYFYVADGVSCGSTNSAVLYIPLHLPHGLIVTGFGCGIYDGSADGFVDRLTFYRQPINSVAYSAVSDLSADSDNSGYQTLSSGTLSHTVDNSNSGYGIRIILGNNGADFSTIASNLRIIGCTVSYQP